MEMKMSGRRPSGTACTWWIDQLKRDVERWRWDWRRADEMQEWAVKTQLETPMQKPTHKCGNDIRKKNNDIVTDWNYTYLPRQNLKVEKNQNICMFTYTCHLAHKVIYLMTQVQYSMQSQPPEEWLWSASLVSGESGPDAAATRWSHVNKVARNMTFKLLILLTHT
jgi:hypothetical protein